MLEHEATFRLAMLTEIAAGLLMLFVVLALYWLLAPVNRSRAIVMAMLGGPILPGSSPWTPPSRVHALAAPCKFLDATRQ